MGLQAHNHNHTHTQRPPNTPRAPKKQHPKKRLKQFNLKPWDVAAGVCILEEAGGRVSTADGLAYSVFDRSLLATNDALCVCVLFWWLLLFAFWFLLLDPAPLRTPLLRLHRRFVDRVSLHRRQPLTVP